MLDADYVNEIANSPVVLHAVNTRPYWREVLEILADEDIWVDYVLSGISISPTRFDSYDDAGVVEHTLVCYAEDGWEGYAIVNWILNEERIADVIGPWHVLDGLQLYDGQEYQSLMDECTRIRNMRLKERMKSRRDGELVDR